MKFKFKTWNIKLKITFKNLFLFRNCNIKIKNIFTIIVFNRRIHFYHKLKIRSFISNKVLKARAKWMLCYFSVAFAFGGLCKTKQISDTTLFKYPDIVLSEDFFLRKLGAFFFVLNICFLSDTSVHLRSFGNFRFWSNFWMAKSMSHLKVHCIWKVYKIIRIMCNTG